MAVITMIMIKKNGFEDNYYNDDAISDSTSKFFLVSALFGEKLRKKIPLVLSDDGGELEYQEEDTPVNILYIHSFHFHCHH